MCFYRNRIVVYPNKNGFTELHKIFFLCGMPCAQILIKSATNYFVNCLRVTASRKVPKEEAQREDMAASHCLTVIAGRKIPKEEAQREAVAASHYTRSQVEQPARATKNKKARRQNGTSYHKMVLNALMEKQELVPEKEKEAFAKEAAATASKLLYRRCWSMAPHMSAMSMAVKEESNDS